MPVLKMTKKVLDLIEPPVKGREEYRDAEVSGLVLRVTASNAMSWTFQYRYEGRNQRFTIGKFPGIKLGVARKRAVTIAGLVAGGANPAEDKKLARVSRKQISGEPPRRRRLKFFQVGPNGIDNLIVPFD